MQQLYSWLSLATVGCSSKNPASQTDETTAAGQQPTGSPAQTEQGKAGADTQAAAQTQAGFDKIIYFDYDSYELSPEGTQTLAGLVDFLKANPTLKVEVAGHCDERGTTEYNMALGDRRAKAARDYCVAQGIDAQRLTAVSYGEEKPAVTGSTEEAWAKNRRAEFLFSK